MVDLFVCGSFVTSCSQPSGSQQNCTCNLRACAGESESERETYWNELLPIPSHYNSCQVIPILSILSYIFQGHGPGWLN